jgi:hypothetical protein|tara:strand:- start:1572 stop:1949 length:378 start_codon:yes stop_codon:yes gene_type:complete
MKEIQHIIIYKGIKMKKLIFLLALLIPISAQEVEKEEVKETPTEKVVRHIQDADFRKFEAAHRRAHSKGGEGHSVRKSKHEIHWFSKVVVITGAGVIGYYIGLNERKKSSKSGWNRPGYYWGERK